VVDTLLRNFRFSINLRGSSEAQLGSGSREPSAQSGDALGDGGFQECSGLEVSMDIQEIHEGGRNDGVIQRVGRAKYVPLVLKRGMFYASDDSVNTDLWSWIQNIVSGVRPVPRYDGVIEVFGETDDVVATWTFERGLPSKIAGPQLNAKTGDIVIEEITIAHQGLKLAGA
jgi:phage tail-like protein